MVRGSAGPAGADPSEFASAINPRGFLTTPSYLRLWFAGGIGNAMRWLELLVAGIFTYEVTRSTVVVALVMPGACRCCSSARLQAWLARH